MKLLYCLLLLLCPYISRAQVPLRIGQSLTAGQLQTIRAGTQQQPSLYILDFWATWCSSCISGLTKINALQPQFENKVQFTLINSQRTGDDPQKVQKAFVKYASRLSNLQSLPRFSNDTIFSKLFPYKELPHYVWLDSTGKVLAITGSNELQANIIDDALKGNTSTLMDKSAFQKFDATRSFFLPNANNDSLAAISYADISTQRPFYLSKFYKAVNNRFHRITAIQKTMLSLYQHAVSIVANRLTIDLPKGHPALTSLYNFELTTLPQNDEVFKKQMHAALNKTFQLDASWQQKEATCYAIVMEDIYLFNQRQRDKATYSTIGMVHFKDQFLDKILEEFNRPLLKDSSLPIIISDCNLSEPISISIHPPAFKGNMQALENSLKRYGLGLLKTKRSLPFFVIRPANNILYHQN